MILYIIGLFIVFIIGYFTCFCIEDFKNPRKVITIYRDKKNTKHYSVWEGL